MLLRSVLLAALCLAGAGLEARDDIDDALSRFPDPAPHSDGGHWSPNIP